jgi:hypothetical protein
MHRVLVRAEKIRLNLPTVQCLLEHRYIAAAMLAWHFKLVKLRIRLA